MINVNQNPAKPATELTFPSVTICSPGLNMEAVEEAIFEDFKKWQAEKGDRGRSIEDINSFMESEYGMKIGEGNIFDKVKEMALPPLSHESSKLIENLATCTKPNSVYNRTKRDTSSRSAGSTHNFGGFSINFSVVLRLYQQK